MFEDNDRPELDIVQACVDRLAREGVLLLRPGQWRVIRCDSEPIEHEATAHPRAQERVRITIEVEQRQDQPRPVAERHPEMQPHRPGISLARPLLTRGGRLVRSPVGRSDGDTPRGDSPSE